MAVLPALFGRGNDALDVNPPVGSERLSEGGSDWLWAVTAIYIVGFLAFFAMTYAARQGEKIFHYLFNIALLVGSIAYFAMASDLGFRVIAQVNGSPSLALTRQIFWPKFVNWVVSFPVLITALGLLSGIPWASIIYNIFLSWIWVISYLVSAFTTSNYKWGFYAFGTVAWLLLAVNTLSAGSSAKRLGVSRDYTMLSGWVNFLWFLYPIAFGVTDGGNTIGVTPGFIFFGVLDLLLVPVTAFAFIALARRWDYNHLNLAFTRYGRVHNGGTFPEKHNTAPATNPTVTA